MKKVVNKIISCTLALFMLGELLIQNSNPFLWNNTKVSADSEDYAVQSEDDEEVSASEAEPVVVDENTAMTA